MGNLRAIVGVLVVASLGTVAGCGSRKLGTPNVAGTSVGRQDAGRRMDGPIASNPDAPSEQTCQVTREEDRREPGGHCTCATDCINLNCQGNICCEGDACGAKRPDGTPCTDKSQCMSDFCVDGVCCNVECNGACLACNLADSPGECAPVGAGVEDGMCRKDDPSSCGQSGVCNGQGACAKYPAETICELGSCNAQGMFVPPGACDGEGKCVYGVAISCNPSKCEKGACVRICNSDTQCVDGRACVDNSCGRFGPGQTCTKNDECESNFCVDGVCCESACDGACKTCASNTNRGRCVPVPRGTTDAMCVRSNPESCGLDGKCDDKGTCSRYDNNTTCRQARCDAGSNQMILAAKCNNGTCPASQTRSCAPFRGCANASACRTVCGNDSQCVSGNFCREGSCPGGRRTGSPCTAATADECESKICAQGICCATQCNGSCKSCALPGQLGTCANVPTGAPDPAGRCVNDACNNNCDGNGGCRRETPGTTCGAASCNGNVRTTRTCTASGECGTNTMTCPAFCTGGACRENCSPETEGRPCSSTGICCNSQCINVANDPNNCQRCGNNCGPGSWTCGSGGCACAAPKVTCGNRCCDAGKMCGPNNTCVDPPPPCRPACGSDQVCRNGDCVCEMSGKPKKCGSECVAADACCPGQINCGGTCIARCPEGQECKPAMRMCGPMVCVPSCAGKACGADDGCGNPCQTGSCTGANRACDKGVCVCTGPACNNACCASGQACVGNACCASNRVCGTGDNRTCCTGNQVCMNGTCQAPCETTMCGTTCCAAGQGCAGNNCCATARLCGSNPTECCGSDETCIGGNCCARGKACGTACCGDNQDCVAGACVAKCDGTRCGAGLCCNANQECENNACVPRCDGTRCGASGCCNANQDCVGGACVPKCDGTRCGAGLCCNANQECENNACVPRCDGTRCGATGCCNANQDCVGGACVAKCDGTRCGAGLCCNANQECENNACVPRCDGTRCGANGCCNANQDCVAGACVAKCNGTRCGTSGCCNANQDCVGGMCVAECDGTRCGTSGCCNANQDCVGGTCVAECDGTRCGTACCTGNQVCMDGRCSSPPGTGGASGG